MLKRAWSFLRPVSHALIMPQAVVLEAGLGAQPLVRQCSKASASLENQLTAAAADFLQMMDEAGVQGRRVQLVVSDFWARPAVLSVPVKTVRDDEADAVLAKHYRSTYGQLMDGWRWCWGRSDQHLVGVAWPEAGLTVLQAGLAARDCVLSSARPLGVDIANGLSSAASTCWMVIIAQPCVTLMRLQNGDLIDWWVLNDAADLPVSLPRQLAREAARRADTCRAVVITDLDDETNLAPLRKALLDAGWASRVASANELTDSLAWRLHRLMTSPETV